jgi:hypothetical protein
MKMDKNFDERKVNNQGAYSQHFVFFVTYQFAQQARVILPFQAFYSSVT